MRSTPLIQTLMVLLVSVKITTAWPWPSSLANVEGILLRRQDNSQSNSDTSSSSPSTTKTTESVETTATSSGATSESISGSSFGSTSGSASTTASSSSKDSTTKGGSAASTSGSSQSAAASSGGSSSKETGNSKTTKSSSKTTAVDPRLPAGGIQMVTPSAIAAAQYYKIGDYVTFAWNYTSLSVTPSAIDILVSCSANSATYTISNNASVAPTGSVVWDTQADATGSAPLLTETYTLVIHDASKDVTAIPSAGYLGTYDQFTFGMYVRQAYTPLNEFICATCSSALSDMERQTMKFLFGMCMITVFSFTWFAGGFGLLF